MRQISLILWAIFCLTEVVLSSPVLIEAVPYEDSDYRLSRDVMPSKYDIKLILNEDFGNSPDFDGTVIITVNTKKDSVAEITLHSNVKEIKLIKFGIPGELIEVGSDKYSVNTTTHKLAIALEDPMVLLTDYSLHIEYVGTLTDNMRGFYRSRYTNENGDDEWLATTQFQATHAREAFPCFDEPGFKAEFDISITRPEGYHTLANTKLKSSTVAARGVEDKFERTPKMSTYLIAFIISKFVNFNNADESYGVYARQEAIQTAKYAYDTGLPVLKAMEDFIGKNYDKQGLGKLHMVAIPDFSAGAMENWGLITYRETALLWDPEHSTKKNKERVATVIAHEIGHFWFGNLVTCHWWSDLWLNEGFARYLQYHITAEVEKDWELEKQFVVEQQQVAFGVDALKSTKAMSTELNSPDEVRSHFSTISYNKGGSVIRMMEHIIGTDNFKQGLHNYINELESGSGTKEVLFEKLGANVNTEDFNLSEIMMKWVNQPGYPVVTLKMDGADAVITQERFFLSGRDEDDNSKWDIPITFVTSHDHMRNFDNTAPELWLKSTDETLKIPNVFHGDSGWIILNNQETGYYRVNYDDKQWNEIQKGLTEKREDVHVLNRAQIVDDVLNLARAGYTSYQNALHVTSYLEKETEYYPWYSASQSFSFLLQRLRNVPTVGDNLTNYVKKLMTALMGSVKFEDNANDKQIDTHKKVLAYTYACELNVGDCVEKSVSTFADYMEKETEVPPNVRSIVYCTAIREGGPEEWDFLWKKFGNTKLATEQILILNALGCSMNRTILDNYLEKSIKPTEGIRNQDASTVFTSVFTNSPQGVAACFHFLNSSYKDISNNYGGLNAIGGIITGLAGRMTAKEQVDALEEFIDRVGDDLGNAAVTTGKSAIESARNNLKWANTYINDINAYFAEKNSGMSVIFNSALSVFLLVVIKVLY